MHPSVELEEGDGRDVGYACVVSAVSVQRL